MDKITSLVEAQREFATQERCEEYLAQMRWPEGVVCPRCGSHEVTRLSTRRKWQCKGCRYQFSVTAGTIFHKTYVDLPRWMMAVWLMCNSPKGCSSKQLERTLGVTYKTAWYMTHRIRKAMISNRAEVMLSGVVEIDDAVVKADGGTATGNVTYQAKNVIGLTSRDTGALRMVVVDTLQREDIRRVIARNLGTVKELITDATTRYNFLGELATHRYVAHYLSWVDGETHTNFIENAWSLFKRGLVGIFHHVSAKYLQDYLDEFAFRYSHRDEKPRLMELVLQSC
jgi:transposase-like protein